MNPPVRDTLDRLTGAMLDGGLSPVQARELDGLLRRSPEAVDRYRRSVELHAMLSFEATACPANPRALGRRAGVNRWRPLIYFGAAAAIVIGFVSLIAMILRVSPPPTERSGPVLATLIESSPDVSWGLGDLPTQPGSQLGNGWLRLRTGSARIEFVSGASLTLRAPAVFGINSAMRGFLKRGTVTAFVPPTAHGFTVAAPGCAVVDLGTRFQLSVDERGRAGVEVLQGRIELHTANHVQRLVAGTQGNVHPDGRVDISTIAAAPNATIGIRFTSGVQERHPDDAAGPVPSTFWNSVPCTRSGGVLFGLRDSRGHMVSNATVRLDWLGPRPISAIWQNKVNTATPQGRFFREMLDGNGSDGVEITIDGVPYARYDVYVCYGFESDHSFDLAVNNRKPVRVIPEAPAEVSPFRWTPGDAGRPGNYTKFTGLTSPRLHLLANHKQTGPRIGSTSIVAVQLVPSYSPFEEGDSK